MVKYIFIVVYVVFAGATVHIVCRNETKGEEAKREIVSESGNEVSAALRLVHSWDASVRCICKAEWKVTKSDNFTYCHTE